MDLVYVCAGGMIAVLGFIFHSEYLVSQYLVLFGAGFAGYGIRGLFG